MNRIIIIDPPPKPYFRGEMSADFQSYSIKKPPSSMETSGPAKRDMEVPTEAFEQLAVNDNATTPRLPASKTAGEEVVKDPKSKREEKLKAISIESVVPEAPTSKILDPKLSVVSKFDEGGKFATESRFLFKCKHYKVPRVG